MKSRPAARRDATKAQCGAIYDLVQPTITYLPLMPKEGKPLRRAVRVRNRMRQVCTKLTCGLAAGGHGVMARLSNLSARLKEGRSDLDSNES